MKLVISFPCDVKQISSTTVEIQVKSLDFPVLTQDVIEALAPDLSAEQQDRLGEDICEFAQAEAIRRSLRVSQIM